MKPGAGTRPRAISPKAFVDQGPRTALPIAGPKTATVRGFLFALALICVAHGETITVATYNVQNYVAANRMTRGGYRPDYPKPEAEKAALRRVIRSIGADVLMLEEMGTEPYLEELRRDLRAEGCHYPYAFLALAGDAERHVAILSKLPMTDAVTLTDLPFAYFGHVDHVKRGLLQATISTSAGPVTLFGLHLKSRLKERPEDPDCELKRIGEATAIRDAVLRRFPKPAAARFIILGDCNDTKASKALERLEHRGDTAIARLLPAIDAHGESWTYYYKRKDEFSRIDHILVSPGLMDSVVGGTAHIYGADPVANASDHRPIYAAFKFDRN